MIKKMYLTIFMFSFTINCSEKDPLLTKDKSAQYADIQLADGPQQNAQPTRNDVQIDIKQAEENQQTAQPQPQQQNEMQQSVTIELIIPQQWAFKCCSLPCTWSYGIIWLKVPIKCSKAFLIQYLKNKSVYSFNNREIEVDFGQEDGTGRFKNIYESIIDFSNPHKRRIKVHFKLI